MPLIMLNQLSLTTAVLKQMCPNICFEKMISSCCFAGAVQGREGFTRLILIQTRQLMVQIKYCDKNITYHISVNKVTISHRGRRGHI